MNNKKLYRFTCKNKNCKNKYVGDTPVMECPKCGTLNQADGSFTPQN